MPDQKPPAEGVYVGPYTQETGRELDARNFWTARQEVVTGGLPETPGPIPDVPPVTINPSSKLFSAGAGGGSFSVTMTGPGVSQSWTVDKDGEATWLLLNSPALHEPQFADGSVMYSLQGNSTGAARTGHFYVNGKTMTIEQSSN